MFIITANALLMYEFLVPPEFAFLKLKEPVDANKGKHYVHTGGQYDTRLILPVIKG